MLQKLEDLQIIVEIPNLYLANYFQELRNNVDKEMFQKQIDRSRKLFRHSFKIIDIL